MGQFGGADPAVQLGFSLSHGSSFFLSLPFFLPLSLALQQKEEERKREKKIPFPAVRKPAAAIPPSAPPRLV